MSVFSPWTFTQFPSLPPPLLPNIAFYNATSTTLNKTYQISISYPFEWGHPSSTTLITNKTALTMYVLDGNALGLTAHEAFFRRKPVDSSQPDSIVVSIGYPLSDSVYDLARRASDFRPPLPTPQTPPSGADAFLEFIDGALRPWVRRDVFPGVEFNRDALYGHSFGGLFVVYALTKDPGLFDTYLSGSPALDWANASILGEATKRFGNGINIQGEVVFEANATRPAVFVGYEGLGQFPIRRRTETETDFQARKNFIQQFKMTEYCHELFDRLKGSGQLRDVVLKEYAGQDHAGVGGSALTDGIDYFVDW